MAADGALRRLDSELKAALFSSSPKNFHPSHRIFEHMHRTLNVDKK